jgi:hypothetical protein
LDNLTTLIAIAIFCAFFAGNVFSSTQRRWRGRKAAKSKSMPWRPQSSHRPQREPLQTPITDAAEQLRLVMQASFDKKRLMSKDEARVFMLIERAVKTRDLSWRVMAQVSLGEIIRSTNPKAHAAINSKRVDILLISRDGVPLAAVEYQGSGHYLGTAAARDAVKREALRRAGVAFIEIDPSHEPADIDREVQRLADRIAAPVA